MSESVSLPALGESVTEGTVTRWLKQVGDRVEVDEPLLEVSTDKVDTEIPSPVAGVIEQILVAEDETVEVGTPLVTIGDGSSSGGGEAPSGEQAAPQEQAAPAEQAPAQEAPAQEAPTQQAPAQEVPQPVSAQEAATPEQGQAAEQSAPEIVPSDAAPAPGENAEGAPVAPAQVDQPPAVQGEPTSQPQEQSAPAWAPAPAAQQAPAEQPQQAAPEQQAPAQPEQQAPAPQAAPEQQAPAQSEQAPAGQGESAAAVAPNANAGYVTPIVRKLANERGIDLGSLTGTGVGGRIRKQDVLAAAEEQQKQAAQSQAAQEQPAQPSQDAGAPAAPSRTVEVSPLRGTTAPMSRLRKVVAERAVISMQSTAQLTSVVEVDVTRVAALRDRVKQQFLEKTGTKLSFLPFFTLAAAEALRTYPIVNATVEGDSIVYPASENISIAVDTERGLLTPVVKNAGDLDLAGIAQQIADLAARTRDNKLKPDELSGGTFTVTNTGSRGALFDTPVVFLPQSAIMGTGIVAKRPVVVSHEGSDVLAIRSMVYLTLSYDHRIIDGADAARFLGAVKLRLEEGDFEGDLGI